MRWRVGAFLIAICAIVALALQIRATAKEEKREKAKQEKRERKRDDKLDELLRRTPKRWRARDSAVAAPMEPNLETRVESLAHKFYSFLRENPTLGAYESKLKPELLALLPELGKSYLTKDVADIEIEPERDDWIASVRNNADTLAVVAVKLAYPKTKISGNYFVLDEE